MEDIKMKRYWVYCFTMPDGMVYIGMSGRKYTKQRWHPSNYIGISVYEYIEKYGWENITREVVKCDLTKDEAKKVEGELIKKYTELNICINKKNSGEFTIQKEAEKKRKYRDEHKEDIIRMKKETIKTYQREHKEEIKAYKKEWDANNKDKIKKYSSDYYKKNKDLILMKAKAKYKSKKEVV